MSETPRPWRAGRVRNALLPVLCNASNFPEGAQPHVLGHDMGPLLDKATDAVMALAALTPDQAADLAALALPDLVRERMMCTDRAFDEMQKFREGERLGYAQGLRDGILDAMIAGQESNGTEVALARLDEMNANGDVSYAVYSELHDLVSGIAVAWKAQS